MWSGLCVKNIVRVVISEFKEEKNQKGPAPQEENTMRNYNMSDADSLQLRGKVQVAGLPSA